MTHWGTHLIIICLAHKHLKVLEYNLAIRHISYLWCYHTAKKRRQLWVVLELFIIIIWDAAELQRLADLQVAGVFDTGELYFYLIPQPLAES